MVAEPCMLTDMVSLWSRQSGLLAQCAAQCKGADARSCTVTAVLRSAIYAHNKSGVLLLVKTRLAGHTMAACHL